jgi:hypothetical protein
VLIEWIATKQGDDALVGGPVGGEHGLNGPDLADADGFAVGFALVEVAQTRVWERLVYCHLYMGKGYSMEGYARLMISHE